MEANLPTVQLIFQLLDDFHGYASTGDFDKYFACFHQNGRFLGTDKTENWTKVEFMEFSRPHFTLGTSAWTFIPYPETRKCDIFASPGDTGTTFATFDEQLDSISFETTARGSGSVIWDIETSQWLITQYYLSFPIPNALAHKMCKDIGLFEGRIVSSKAADDDWLNDVPRVKSSHKKGKGNKK